MATVGANFTRISLAVRDAVYTKLSQPQYAAIYNKIITRYQSTAEMLYIRKGKAKVEDRFPCIAIELNSREEQWVAIDYFKETKISLNVYVMLKNLTSPARADQDPAAVMEDYIGEMADLTYEILNEPSQIPMTITEDADRKLDTPAYVFDAFATNANFGFLYNGAIRAAEIQWWGKVQRANLAQTFLS